MRGMLGLLLLFTAACSKCGGSLTSDGLPERAAERLRREFPTANVSVVDQRTVVVALDGGATVQVGLDNLRVACATNPEGCDGLLARTVDSARDVLTPDGFVLKPAAVRFVLKAQGDVDQVNALTLDGGPKKQVAMRPVLGGLWQVYVIDRPTMLQMLTRAQQAELSLDDAALDVLARQNLLEALPPLQAEPFAGNADVLISGAGESYAAAQVLFPERFEPYVKQLGGTLTMAIPTRGVIFLTGSTDPERLAGLRRVVEKMVADEPYALSKELYRWSKDGWQVLAPPGL